MKCALLAVFLLLTTLISGCVQSGPKCSPPYMEYGDMHYCCLDANENNICDKYEKGTAGEENKTSSTTTRFTTTMPLV